jgi:glucose uptake protein GlcU
MGYLYAFGAFLCIGSYLMPVRFATAKGLQFFPFMGLGMGVLELFRISSLEALWAHPLWFWGSVLAGLLWAAGQTLANVTLEAVSLAKASVLFNANTFINIAFGLFAFHEASGLKSYLFLLGGGILLFLGAWWVATISAASAQKENLKKGVLFGLLTAIFWGVYFAPTKAVQVWDPQAGLSSLDVLTGMILGGTVPALVLFAFCPKKFWTFRNIAAGAGTTVLWASGTSFFLLANQALGLSRAIPIVNASGLVYAFWSLFVFKEFPLSAWPKVVSGTLIVVAGVILMALSS